MREYKETTKTYKYVSRVFCDCCKKEVASQKGYRHQEVEITKESGHNWPEGPVYIRTTYDICVDCFEERVEPFLKSIGLVKITEEVN
jgi:hypothetical protein